MVRSLTALLLIFTVLSANFSKLFIYAGYEANKKFIAATLCENKEKPQLQCLGKCYLMKKVKQAEDKEKNQERQSQKHTFQEALIGKEIRLSSIVIPLSPVPFPELNYQIREISDSIFQPPRA